MNWLNNLKQKIENSQTEAIKRQEEARMERIKVKCPFCKAQIPANATRCSHCAADLSSKETQANIESQIKADRKKIITGFVALAIFVIFFIILIASISTNAPKSTNQSVTSVQVGQDGFLRSNGDSDGITFLATTPEAFDELMKTIRAKDTAGLLEMAAYGRAFGVTNGTKVKVIDSAIGRRRVRIMQGVKPIDSDKVGLAGWVPMEWVKSQ